MDNFEVKVHSNIIEKVGPSSRLYYYCKGLDVKGAGCIKLSKNNILEDLDISLPTLNRWLRNSKIFRNVIRHQDYLTIYLHSVIKVCINYELQTLGTGGFIPLEDLKSNKEIKTASTLMTAQSIQAQSRWIVRRLAKKDKTKKLAKPEDYFLQENPSVISQGVLFKSKKSIFLDETKLKIFGTSLEGISIKNGRSKATVKRRLKDVDKLRQFLYKPQNYHIHKYYEYIDTEEWTNKSDKYYQFKDKTYKAYTNLYYPQYQVSLYLFFHNSQLRLYLYHPKNDSHHNILDIFL